MHLLVFHAYIKEMHGSRSKIFSTILVCNISIFSIFFCLFFWVHICFIYSPIQGKPFIWQISVTFMASLQRRSSYTAPFLLSSFGYTNASKQFMTHASVGAAGMQALTRPPPYNKMYRNWCPHAPQIYRNSDVPVPLHKITVRNTANKTLYSQYNLEILQCCSRACLSLDTIYNSIIHTIIICE
jgi:hypothetical protein